MAPCQRAATAMTAQLLAHLPATREGYGQRTGGVCGGRGVGLDVGAAAGRGGGSETLSKMACWAVSLQIGDVIPHLSEACG
jgi:hypothetical protein